ncbi:hypothetical protein HNQ35_000041 [Cerasibacillus quisquiliarum]|uniref:DUF1064 domain-containing protein n=1 Tax=Cerasibacillus quisquiliarum TaxID=227865 RepID=A0A511UUG7_9BACI|nr:DUF1064 domain-containing protein [Cerasibacillus quisquiliarum]MBB5144852.1 hypothetical protein [Cerasibacillus quisquiliarum]GEN30255.1 hypothetical protein CQU01_04930 [Cerasibacillus quisquiliarum]
MQRMTARQYRKMSKRRSKYRNKKVQLDGHTFDSKAEARYYQELKLMERAGEILFFRLQPRYRLLDGFEKHGKKHRAIDYIADFEIHHKDGSIEVVDIKGYKTDVFRIKEKMFNKKYPHKLSILKLEKGRFVEI